MNTVSETTSRFLPDADVTRIKEFIGQIEGRMIGARESGIVARRNSPTKFARGEHLCDPAKSVGIMITASGIINAIPLLGDTQEELYPNQGDILYSWISEGTRVRLLAPNLREAYQDTTTKELGIRVNTDGINDMDLLLTTDGEFTLKLFFGNEESEGLVYNSGKISLAKATDEEIGIVDFVLHYADKLIA